MDLGRKKKLKSENFNVKWNEESIYINDCLTQANSNLFYKTRMYVKAHNYKYVWFIDSKIFLRKYEKNKIIFIKDENSLNNIV